jgi:hypothetical protein
MPDAKRPVRERGKFLYDHPANAIGGGLEGGYPGSTFGQEFFLGLLVWMRNPQVAYIARSNLLKVNGGAIWLHVGCAKFFHALVGSLMARCLLSV